MAAVARALLRVEDARELRRKAVALPVREAARERDDVLVTELLECLRREGRPVAGLAVEDDRPPGRGREAASRSAAALVRVRRARRPRGDRSLPGSSASEERRAQARGCDLRPLPLVAGADRLGLRGLAGSWPRRAEAARRHA